MAYESDSSLKLYLREISKTPLLTVEEEIQLAARIKNGDSEARSHMIRANLRLVVKIAQDYSNYGMPVTDLISEGNIGLMKAVERFDPEKGGKLSTYAAWWIKQSIKRALANQSKTIRLPVHMVDKIAKMRRIATILTEALGREPTDEELADEVGLPHRKLALLRQASYRPTSLDAPINEGEATEFGEVISDERAENPLDMLSDKNMHGELAADHRRALRVEWPPSDDFGRGGTRIRGHPGAHPAAPKFRADEDAARPSEKGETHSKWASDLCDRGPFSSVKYFIGKNK
jgi:RNA polymerase primary sigma factor